jgi:AcrR family transcriptional regulator
MTTQPDGLSETAERIVLIASRWMDENPGQSLTTRKVCELAGVTAPTLYHHFGDKQGLMQAVAERKMLAFFSGKRQQPETDDPRADLLRGWDQWLDFARQNPALIAALQRSPEISARLRAGAEAIAEGRLKRLQSVQALRTPPEQAAQVMVAASNVLVQLIQQGMPEAHVRAINEQLQTTVMKALTEK